MIIRSNFIINSLSSLKVRALEHKPLKCGLTDRKWFSYKKIYFCNDLYTFVQVKALERTTYSEATGSTPISVSSPVNSSEVRTAKTFSPLRTPIVPLWTGAIRMEPAHFLAELSHAGGPSDTAFEVGLPDSLVICGNIQPAGVSDYLSRYSILLSHQYNKRNFLFHG